VPKVDVEVQVKAIELVRSGEARNPNDLLLKLKIPLDIAEKLFSRILENEGITTLILDVVRELGDLVEEAKELKEALKCERSKLLGEILKLQDLIDEARKLVEELKELKKLGVEIAKLPGYLKRLQELRRKFEDLKQSFEIPQTGQLSSRTNTAGWTRKLGI
jgi:predicted nuclease with TOPRIM domain